MPREIHGLSRLGDEEATPERQADTLILSLCCFSNRGEGRISQWGRTMRPSKVRRFPVFLFVMSVTFNSEESFRPRGVSVAIMKYLVRNYSDGNGVG